jgi:hypothetical protein
MKSLYESILGSTKTGKTVFTEKMKEWARENIATEFCLTPNISSALNSDLRLKSDVKEIPEYVKFDYVNQFFINNLINEITEKQFPKEINILKFHGNVKKLNVDFTLKVNKVISCTAYSKLLEKIEKFDIEFTNPNSIDSGNLDLALTSLDIDEIQKINAKNIKNLNILDTPAAKYLLKIAKKFQKSKDVEGFNEYINKTFSNMQGLSVIILNSRTLIHKRGNNWILV